MVVAHNLAAMNASRQFNIVNNAKAKTSEKLASGYRVNRAADDAAGLAISEKMRRQIRGLNKGTENIQSGISLLQVADGALAEVDEMLHRMTELSVKAANATNNLDDRMAIQAELDSLSSEIDRIGKSTRYNEHLLFDDFFGKNEVSITKLVTSPAAETGYLSEAYQDPGGSWHAASTLDFSNINPSNMEYINGKGFFFNCSIGCDEAFEFALYCDGTPSSAENLSGAVTHKYKIDISGCTNGADIVRTILDYTKNHMPNGYSMNSYGELPVSHSNVITSGTGEDGTQSLLILHETNARGSEAAAKGAFGPGGRYGRVDAASLAGEIEMERINEIPIQCSSDVNDVEMINTRTMNANILGVRGMSVLTEGGSKMAITSVKKALERVSFARSELGAYQNRLSHAMAINQNTAENTQAAESKIRDTDMAKTMVQESLQNILEQAGVSVMAQTNQINQEVLSLLS